MSAARYLVGDVFERMAELPGGSVDLVMTSPPFLALRSYLPDGHPDKAREIGSEATPAEFIDTLLALTAEWRRLLAPHGSICVELGDTYAGSGGAGGDYSEGGLRDGQQRFDGTATKARRLPGDYPNRDDYPRPKRDRTRNTPGGWPMEKSLTGIPDAYELSLAYGYNVLDRRGPDSPAGRWRVRNKVAWVRPNPPVGALADKFRPATSYLTVATIARDRYFDLDAVRTPSATAAHHDRYPQAKYVESGKSKNDDRQDGGKISGGCHPAGAPPLDWWEIPPGGYSGSHYAVYPTELCEKPIEAMCPRRVCTTCGQPSRRITEAKTEQEGRWTAARTRPAPYAEGNGQTTGQPSYRTTHHTVGWSDCGHATWRPGLVLDPFAGSGTTLVVAHGRSRDAIGIDIDSRNADLARERLGMFLEVDGDDCRMPA